MNWQKTRLGNIITTKKGFAFKSAKYVDSGVPIVRVSDFTSDSISEGDLKYYPKEEAQNYLDYELHYKDIIIQTVGSWPNNPASVVGKVVRVPYILDKSLLNQNAVKIVPKNNIDNDFLYYRLKSRDFDGHVIGQARGAANQASITLETIRSFKMSIPDYSEQIRLGKILTQYDDLIANNNKRIKILEQMAENLYKEWFVRFRFPGYEKAEFVDGVPKGWDVYRLDEICDINKHSMKKSDKIDKIQYLDTGSLTENSITNLEDYYRSDAPSRAKRKVKKNSILFSTVRPALKHYGILKKVPENMIVSTGFAVLDSKYDIANIIYMYLSSDVVLSYCQMIAEGAVATYPTIKPEEIGKIKIVLPPIETAADWNEKLEVFFSMQLKLIEQNQNLIKQRDYLLSRLMSGKLQVK